MAQQLRRVLGVGFLLLTSACLFVFFHTISQEEAADALYAGEIRPAVPVAELFQAAPLDEADTPPKAAEADPWQDLRAQFPDLVAWITGPDWDYPVVQGTDNAFYLTHLADGSPNQSGAIFLDAGAAADFSGDIACIYGHTITRDTMFSGLRQYRDAAYCREHPTLLLETPDGPAELTVIGVCLRRGDDPYPAELDSPADRAAFLTWVADHSLVSLDVSVDDEPLVILSTCAYDYENARLAVVTRLNWKERNEAP